MKRYTRNILLLALLLPVSLMALTGRGYLVRPYGSEPIDAKVSDTDTTDIDLFLPPLSDKPVYGKIMLNTRSYGDSIVLRWVGEDWAVQQSLFHVGVDIIRFDYGSPGGARIDTLAHRLMPWTKDEFMRRYEREDSLANIAIALLYGNGELKQDQTLNQQGTMGAWIELSENQKQHIIFSELVAEWRNDLADHMAMRWVDRNVKLGHSYEYAIVPSYYDATGSLNIASASKTVKNERFVKPRYNVEMSDSILGPYRVYIRWENRGYSSYEIERRKEGEEQWTRLTQVPYLQMNVALDDVVEEDCHFSDVVDELGVYEYRVFGHDPFGELSEPSPVLRVVVPDVEAPRAPELVLVEIDRQDSTDLSKQVMATFHFEKDSLEDDFVGFMPMYYSARKLASEQGVEEDDVVPTLEGKRWKDLAKEMLPPDAKTFTCDMTGFSTGMVVVAAYDTAHNVSYSMPRMIQIKDVKAPAPMRNFKAETNVEDGTIRLTWEPDPADDDIEYYEVTVANDTTHSFMLATKEKLTKCEFVDTVAMDVNQKYIYYRVRAIDYSTNQGDDTPTLQVIRPSRLIPEVPHLLKSSVDSLGIHMEWACSNEQVLDHHVLLRRLQDEEKWDTLAVYNADSVKAAGNSVVVLDKPEYDRQREYQYCMESVTCSGIRSGHSLLACFLYEGPRLLHIPLALQGRYDADADETILTWEINDGKPLEGDWYISLFRKGPDDEYSKFYISLPADKRERHSSMLMPGQSESYYIRVIYDDGRESYPSQSVTVTATKKEQ